MSRICFDPFQTALGIGNPKNTKSMVNSHRMPPVMWTGVRPNAEYAVRSGLRHIQFTVPVEEDGFIRLRMRILAES